MKAQFCAGLALLAAFGGPGAYAAGPEDIDFVAGASLPPEAIAALSGFAEGARYALSTRLNPFYLQGDFDGDGRQDVAILVTEKTNGKAGIAVLIRSGVKLIGAGNNLGNGGDDFVWMDAWYVYARAEVGQGAFEGTPPQLKGDAIMVIKTEIIERAHILDGHGFRLVPAGRLMADKHEILRRVFGYDGFRPGQKEIVEELIAGRHVLAVMPTGSGKSLCYQVPALVRGGLAIVVSPLVALMQDQVAALKLAGVEAETINSSISRAENVAAWRRVTDGKAGLLYLAPERLMTERMLAALARYDVRLIAVDEAHCISQWGASFRPEYEALARLKEAFPGVPIGAFTATADETTRNDIVAKLFDTRPLVHVAGFDRPNIRLGVAAKHNTSKQLREFLERHKGESGIVYCLSRKSTEDTAAMLNGSGIRALAYHAGLDAGTREENQNLFMTEPALVMCATIAFGMGIDKPDVRFVFHADLPATLDAYYQEIGRAGRDGSPAVAQMVFGLDDLRMRRRFIAEENSTEERKRREHKRLDALIAYCESPSCRRQALLAYFGERSEPCGNCDICLEPAETEDGTIDAQKILSAVHRSGQRFGAAHIVDILEGVATDKVLAVGHETLPTFGVGRERKRTEWQSLIRQLVAAGFLTLDVAGYGGLAITSKGRGLLKGEERFLYRKDMVKRKRRRDRSEQTAGQSELSVMQASLLQRLKSLRWRLAHSRKVPAYVIFPDRTLIDMAGKMPKTRDEFAQINGVGEAKLREFAEVFLAEITEHKHFVEA